MKFFVQEEKLSLDAMATEFFSSRVHVIVGAPWKDAVISHLEPRSASCVTEDVWTCALCAVAYTPEDLATLLADKLPCWRWAACASVLVQRRAEVQPRLRDSQLAYGRPTGERADSGAEVGRFVVDRMDELLTLVNQVESFMLTPAFVGVFGDPGDESTADADGILHVANRLMDYHERFLELAQRCRGLSAPSHCAGLLRDVGRLMDVPLAGYRTFIDDFVERVGEMPELLHYARGTVEAATVELHMDTDDELLERITKQINQIAVD